MFIQRIWVFLADAHVAQCLARLCQSPRPPVSLKMRALGAENTREQNAKKNDNNCVGAAVQHVKNFIAFILVKGRCYNIARSSIRFGGGLPGPSDAAATYGVSQADPLGLEV